MQTCNATGSVVNGDNIWVMGNRNTVNGDYCKVQGDHNKVNGDYCNVIGNHCTITGDFCTYAGHHNTVQGYANQKGKAYHDKARSRSTNPQTASKDRDRDRDNNNNNNNKKKKEDEDNDDDDEVTVVNVGNRGFSGVVTAGRNVVNLNSTSGTMVVNNVRPPALGHLSGMIHNILFSQNVVANQINAGARSIHNVFNPDGSVITTTATTRTATGLASANNNNNNNNIRSTVASPAPPEALKKTKYPTPWAEEPKKCPAGKSACVICFEREAIVIALPCAHIMTCVACCARMAREDTGRKCCTCNAAVVEYKRVFSGMGIVGKKE